MSGPNESNLSRRLRRSRHFNRAALVLALVGTLAVVFMSLPLASTSNIASADVSGKSSSDVVEADGYCVLSPISLEQRVDNSTLIVEGQVVSSYSFWDKTSRNIFTSNTVQVFKLFQGDWQEKTLEVITEGGTVGDKKEIVTPSLQLAQGDMGTFFLVRSKVLDSAKQSRNLPFMAYSSVQGFIRYDLKSRVATEPFRTYGGIETDLYGAITSLTRRTFLEIAENRGLENSYRQADVIPDAPPTISGFLPNPITAGTGSILTITGTNFGAVQGTGTVEFLTGNDGGSSFIPALASDYVSWSNTQIQVFVPGVGNASTGVIRVTNSDPAATISTNQLVVTYSIINVNDGGFGKHGLHQNRNGTGGYSFQVSNNAVGGMSANAPAVASFLRAMNTWVASTGINFTRGADTAVNTASSDGVNIVTFDDANVLNPGVLASMTSRFSGCGPGPGFYDWFVSELDMRVLRPTQISWQYGPAAPGGNQFDFETVMLHELGHGHQFGHNNNGSAGGGSIMYWAVSPGVMKRTASVANDIPAGQYTMGLSTMTDQCANTRMISLHNKVADFDGDGLTDVSVFRPGNGAWYLLRSTAGFFGVAFGQNRDTLAPGDYDGDGKTDICVYRNGTWYRLNSSNGAFVAVVFGTTGDIPVPGRYDNDNSSDIAVFRPANGTWYYLASATGAFVAQQFGQNGDLPVSGDFDGDSRTDLTVFRPATGSWYSQQSTAGFVGTAFGSNGDIPVPGDYDKDSKTDIAVFRPSTGTWYLRRSLLGLIAVNWGVNGDQPSAGDYDGDNRTDVAVFRGTTGTFYISQSGNGLLRADQFGANGDMSVPRAYAP